MCSTADTSFAVPQQVPDASETVVGPNTRCVGTLRSTGSVRIDGAVEGTLAVAGTLVIGESGRVNATVTAQNGYVAGTVTGTITIVEQLDLAPTATIRGRITGTIKVSQPPGHPPASRIWDHFRTAAWPVEQGSAHIVALLQGMRKDRDQQGHWVRNLSFLQVERQALLDYWRLWREDRLDSSYGWRRSFAIGTVAVLMSVLIGIAIVVALYLIQR